MASSTSGSSLLASVHRALELKNFPMEWVGLTDTPFLAWLLAQDTAAFRPRLIVCANEKTVRNLAKDITAIRPSLIPVTLEAFDESPYSGLYPSQWSLQARTHFLWKARHAKSSDIFICSIESILQKTLPIEQFRMFEVEIRKGDEIDVSTLCQQLVQCGYGAAPLVEDCGTFSRRGDILDIFSPTMDIPLRLEFFGDRLESLRVFSPETQRSEKDLDSAVIVPAREILLLPEILEKGRKNIKNFCDEYGITKDRRENLLAPLAEKILPHGIDYWVSFFYDKAESPLAAFSSPPVVYFLDSLEITRAADGLLSSYKDKFRDLIKERDPVPDPASLYLPFDDFRSKTSSSTMDLNRIQVNHGPFEETVPPVSAKIFDTSDFSTIVRASREAKRDFFEPASEKLREWRSDGYHCFVWAGTQTQAQRIQYLLETHGLSAQTIEAGFDDWRSLREAQNENPLLIHVLPKPLSGGGRFVEERLVFIGEEDLFGARHHQNIRPTKGTLEQRANKISFGDLNPGDFIVHVLHGVGVYEGLKKLAVQGVENEFIQLKYKENDKLYLPVYRISQIQKYSSPGGFASIDKLGSTAWQKAKVKVRSALKDLANELLALYAKRKTVEGFALPQPDDDFREFEATFPYDETPDQAKAINDVLSDMEQPRPMDRLVCGDVGFGKTEVAIRAAYLAIRGKKQVAVLVPTTVLAFQHFQTFKKRFADTAVNVAMVSRFSNPTQAKKALADVAEGKIDILIGTHRLLSKDVVFKDLGLLVIDEEQKFGVGHKEKIKRFRTQVHVLTLSATPIPRTLNLSLMGVRDLSIINTPPQDRLSIRTFISRFDEETIRKAILSEVHRGGQVFFIHNRVQSIHGFTDEIRRIVPAARIRLAHGQMVDEDLEKTMVDFYNHEFDVLVCTTIIESGLDIPLCNTILIDRADTFGLSQLYQLRGRVGRSKERAYAYLLIPPQGVVDKTAQERLKVIQEYTELGSGFHIAHHDLELRGSGNILGEDQSGHISSVGYELYMELLEQALNEVKGEPSEEEIEPEINLRIPALIPDSYIEDIRMRLSYYKALGDIRAEEDLDAIEQELTDRFGPVPEQVTNLFGIMLIRKYCKDLGVRDISSGPKNLGLLFSNATKVAPEAVVRLATKSPQKYQLSPDQKLIIRLNSTGWPPILEELKNLKKSLF